MNDTWKKLYTVVQDRRVNPQEGSYTCLLYTSPSDLLYHLTVLMVEQDIPLEAVMDELDRRSQKIGNLKTFHQSDHES